MNYDFCVSTIEANPKSHSADLATLTMIVLDLAGAKVTSINSHIQELKKDPKVDQPALQDYEEVYSDATGSMQEATNSFKAKNYESTLNTLSAALNAPDHTCETGFQERKAVSPLKEDNDFT